METSLGLYLLSVAGITLVGTMIPGPVVAATVAQGYKNKNAGILIGIGCGLANLPLMAVIYFGFGQFLASPQVQNVVGIASGLVLVYMGFRIFRTAGEMPGEATGLPRNSILTGALTWAINPFFFVWWVTVGTTFVVRGAEFGIGGIILLAVVMWFSASVWLEFLSQSAFRSSHLWTQKVRRIVFSTCSFVLIGFGAWFLLSVLLRCSW